MKDHVWVIEKDDHTCSSLIFFVLLLFKRFFQMLLNLKHFEKLFISGFVTCWPTVRWYQSWSFLRSPGWVQIKCELRVLAGFPFNLNSDWELPAVPTKTSQPLKEGVRDMLVKHHLLIIMGFIKKLFLNKICLI